MDKKLEKVISCINKVYTILSNDFNLEKITHVINNKFDISPLATNYFSKDGMEYYLVGYFPGDDNFQPTVKLVVYKNGLYNFTELVYLDKTTSTILYKYQNNISIDNDLQVFIQRGISIFDPPRFKDEKFQRIPTPKTPNRVKSELTIDEVNSIKCVIKDLEKKGYYPIKYLARGNFGRVFKICDKETCNYIVKASFSSIEKDIKYGKLASDLGIGPKIYYDGSCKNYQGRDINYIVMEYVKGVPIGLYDIKKWTVKLFLKIETMVYKLFEKGYCHRDLHSGNVMITDDGNPVIIDYGEVENCDNIKQYLEDIEQFFASLGDFLFSVVVENIKDKFKPTAIILYSAFVIFRRYALTYNTIMFHIIQVGTTIPHAYSSRDFIQEYSGNVYFDYIINFYKNYYDPGLVWEELRNKGINMSSPISPDELKIQPIL